MNLKPKISVSLVFIFLSFILTAQQNSDSVLFERKLDSLSSIIDIIKSEQKFQNREMQKQIRTFESEIDSMLHHQESLMNKLERKDEQLDGELSSLDASVQAELKILAREREKVKKRFILSLLFLFVVVVILFIYFFYRNYLIERYIDERFLKVSMESDTRMDSLNRNILSRIKKLKKRNKRTSKDLQKAEKRFSKLRKKKK